MYTKFIFISCLLVGLSCLADRNFSTEIITNSTIIAVEGGITPTPKDIGDSVDAGDVITFGGGDIYLALESGTVSSDPAGVNETSTSPILRKCKTLRASTARRKLIIFEAVSGDVWWTIGDGEAEVGKGISLKEGERMWISDPGSLKMISETSATVSSQELY